MRAPCDRGLTDEVVLLTEVGRCASGCWWWWLSYEDFSGLVVIERSSDRGGGGRWKVCFDKKRLVILGLFRWA